MSSKNNNYVRYNNRVYREDYFNTPSCASGYGNTVLYKMCSERSFHSRKGCDDEVCAQNVVADKLLVIGRVYAASPQRGAGDPKNEEQFYFFKGLAKKLMNDFDEQVKNSVMNESRLDIYLSRLNEMNFINNQIECKDNIHTLHEVLKVHNYLNGLICDYISERDLRKSEGSGVDKKKVDIENVPRNQGSFCSKYLHFHMPDYFPIMDSYVKRALNVYIKENEKAKKQYKLLKNKVISGGNENNYKFDNGYFDFCCKIISYWNCEGGRATTLRMVDKTLMEAEQSKRLERERKAWQCKK